MVIIWKKGKGDEVAKKGMERRVMMTKVYTLYFKL